MNHACGKKNPKPRFLAESVTVVSVVRLDLERDAPSRLGMLDSKDRTSRLFPLCIL
jgi:hypothetical protein